MRKTLTAVLVTLALAAGAAQAEISMGLLTPQLPINTRDGVWTGTESGRAFTLSNETDATALRYYYVQPAGAMDVTVGVDVLVGPGADPQAFGGIIFGFKPETRYYHLFALGPDGTVLVFDRDADGLRLMMSSTSDAVKPGGWNRLQIVETGDRVSFSVNGAGVGSIESDRLGEGGFGIAVAGLAQVSFADFTAETSAGPISAGQ